MSVHSEPALTVVSSLRSRAMKVCDYVHRPFDEVVAMLGADDAAELLASALGVGLGPDVTVLEVRADVPVLVRKDIARFDVSWSTTGPAGEATEGRGTILVLVVNSGHDAMTEVLVTVKIADELSLYAAAATHRFLDELTARLTHAPAPSEG